MKMTIKTLCSFVVLGLLTSAPVISVAQQSEVKVVQASYTHACRAENGFGSWGVGAGYNFHYACRIAVMNCAANSPVGTVCTATNWWYI